LRRGCGRVGVRPTCACAAHIGVCPTNSFSSQTDNLGVTDSVPRVLVVDDEGAIRRFVERVLRDAGYDVVMAGDGWEAMRTVEREHPFDVFVLDLMMPEMRGDELARQLWRGNPDVKVLYFTGFSDRLFAEKFTLGENEAFIDKPVSIKGLREAVSLLLYGHIHGPSHVEQVAARK
jgi:CheY-like chemotaxis protein